MRPRLLDLFAGAGGSARGYQMAGFHVTGVDVKPQPRYAGDAFIQGDALAPPVDLAAFDAIHASPPCQDYSAAMRHLALPQPRLIGPVREMLASSGVPYIIENVEGAPLLRQPGLFGSYGVMLCGTSFGLRVYHHRLFESNIPLTGLSCDHREPAMNPHNGRGRGRIYDEYGRGDPEKVWLREKGVAWMTRYEGREAIPPAMARFLGRQLLNAIIPTSVRSP